MNGKQGVDPADSEPRRRGIGAKSRRAVGRLSMITIPFIAILVLWEILVVLLDVQPYILPKPTSIVAATWVLLGSGAFWNNVRVTLAETLLGYLLGCSIAFVLGIAIAKVATMRRVLMPAVVGFEAVPKIALAPLFVVWFGFGMTPKVVLAGLICFFPMLVNVVEGLGAVDRNRLDVLKSLRATRRQIFLRLELPSALPFIFAALDIGFVLAVIGAVVAEFVGAKEGLGYLLLQMNYQFRTAEMFGALMMLSMFGIVGHNIVRALQRRFTFWNEM